MTSYVTLGMFFKIKKCSTAKPKLNLKNESFMICMFLDKKNPPPLTLVVCLQAYLFVSDACVPCYPKKCLSSKHQIGKHDILAYHVYQLKIGIFIQKISVVLKLSHFSNHFRRYVISKSVRRINREF